jgi:two-component system NtrC family sensor kinase
MFRSLAGRILLVSVLPLLVIAFVNFLLFFNLNRSIVIEYHANSLRNHRGAIDAFLDDLTGEMQRITERCTLAELVGGELERIFPLIQRGGVLTDIGIIDSGGRHLKYVGPFDLAGKNYYGSEWFSHTVREGVYISDVFLGFRGVPHFVIAVKHSVKDDFWILRATVNSETFSRLVDATRSGRTGETFIVNSQGLYQTKTRFAGNLLEASGFPDLKPHEDIRVREIVQDGKRFLCSTTWLEHPCWLIIFRQQVWDVFSPLRNATAVGMAMCLLGLLGGGLLAVVVARAQVRRIRTADRDTQALTERLVAAGKTAAVGEMSAGLAHEINNPLATIDTLQTWIRDLGSAEPIPSEDRREILESAAKIGEQVERCKTITQGLLKFARKVESKSEAIDAVALIEELAVILRTRAVVEGSNLEVSLEPVPRVMGAPSHLQQVIVNLVNNALDAVEGKADGRVVIRTWHSNGKVCIEVADNGHGVSPEHLSSIFLPFFTTKPVGRGTGLGLSICHGLVQDLRGTISVNTGVGSGTSFLIELPVGPEEESKP